MDVRERSRWISSGGSFISSSGSGAGGMKSTRDDSSGARGLWRWKSSRGGFHALKMAARMRLMLGIFLVAIFGALFLVHRRSSASSVTKQGTRLSLSLYLKNMHKTCLSVSVSLCVSVSSVCEYHIDTSPSSPAFESILHISTCAGMHAMDVHRIHPCASGEVYPLDAALDVCPSFLKSSFCREIQLCLNAARHQCCCCCQGFVIVVQTIQCVLKLYRDPVLAECSSKRIIMLLSLKICCCSELWIVA
jgi:hypothetical protein